jgi:hypothetical protein
VSRNRSQANKEFDLPKKPLDYRPSRQSIVNPRAISAGQIAINQANDETFRVGLLNG